MTERLNWNWNQCRRRKRHGFDSWVRKIPWRRKWTPTPIFLPGESHGQRSLLGYETIGVSKSQTQLKRLSTHTGILYHTLNLKSDSKTYTIWLLLISPSPLQSPFLLFSLLHPLGHLDVPHLCKACPISWLHMAVPSARDLFPPDLHLTPSHLTSICSISPLRAAFW